MNIGRLFSKSPIVNRTLHELPERQRMDSLVVLSDQVMLWNRGSDGKIKEIASYSPRQPLDLRDLKISPEGRQIMAISTNPAQGVSFACFTKNQKWKFYDHFPKEFSVACGVFSPTSNHIVYLATTTGGLIEFDLRKKIPSLLSKGTERPEKVNAIDINSNGSHLAISQGGSILIHSVRNKVNTVIDYDKRQNSRVLIKFHPTRQFFLGAFSLSEGAAILDLSSSIPSIPKTEQKFRPPSGEAHICEPTDLLWNGIESLLTIANDGRIVIYNKKKSHQLYRSKHIIQCAGDLKEGVEFLIGLENELACFDLKKHQISWKKPLQTLKPVKLIAKARSHLPIASHSNEIESMYTQKEPQNPDIFTRLPMSNNRSSDANLISPLRGFEGHLEAPNAPERSRKSSLGSLISPPKAHVGALQVLKNLSLPSRRSLVSATIREELINDVDWKENDNTVMQSTVLNESDSYNGPVDFGLDSTSPVKVPRQPFSLRNSSINSSPVEKKIFSHVDSERSALNSKLEQSSPPYPSAAPLLEKQNALLTTLLESNLRLEKKLNELVDEVREQSMSSRRLIDHGIQLASVYHSENTSVLRELIETQSEAWLYSVEDSLRDGNSKL